MFGKSLSRCEMRQDECGQAARCRQDAEIRRDGGSEDNDGQSHLTLNPFLADPCLPGAKVAWFTVRALYSADHSSQARRSPTRKNDQENGAQKRTRTSTPLRAPAPEAGASTNSAIWARGRPRELGGGGALVNAANQEARPHVLSAGGGSRA